MLCKIGTMKECNLLSSRIPLQVIDELKTCIGILDDAYGTKRNCYRVGGYVVFADTDYDVAEVEKTFMGSLYEWSRVIDDYLVELYLLGDDFAIVFCYPENLKKREVNKNEDN